MTGSILSYWYLLLLVPSVVGSMALLERTRAAKAALPGLAVVSLAWYGAAQPVLLASLACSLAVNFYIGRVMWRMSERGDDVPAWRLLVFSIALNLLPLIGFKAIGAVAGAVGTSGTGVTAIALPLGISFITFQQIAYLVDIYRGEPPLGFVDYVLYVSFFAKIIAGPVWRHADYAQELRERQGVRVREVAAGLSILTIGLFKKVVLGDGLAPIATALFGAVNSGSTPTLSAAWVGAVAYAFQLYFDFSGYSDMAIGTGRMLGLPLPTNFLSPYKARSVVEFWKRWHISVSNLFFEFVYMPMVVTFGRRWTIAPFLGLMMTMLVCGAWHGTGWTFIVWGAIHGVYLCANHLWRRLRGAGPRAPSIGVHAASVAITFAATVAAWVVFRAGSLTGAATVWTAMAGLGGQTSAITLGEIVSGRTAVLLLASAGVVWLLPNTEEWMSGTGPAEEPWRLFRWRPSPEWAICMAGAAAVALLLMSRVQSDFIYFQF